MDAATEIGDTQFRHALSNHGIQASVASLVVELYPKQKRTRQLEIPKGGISHQAITTATALTDPYGGLS
jgi:hypothetical protein